MKDFYKITDMSVEFDEYRRQLLMAPDLTAQIRVQLWQAGFMLAIAQQLSMVASHLGKIVRKAETSNGQD